MKKHYALEIKAEEEHQPSLDEISEAICDLVKKKTEGTQKGYRVEVVTDFSKS